MKRDYLKKNKILGVNLLYVLSLLPIIIYSFYKNGIVPFINESFFIVPPVSLYHKKDIFTKQDIISIVFMLYFLYGGYYVIHKR